MTHHRPVPEARHPGRRPVACRTYLINPDQIIAQAREILDCTQPIAVMFMGVLGVMHAIIDRVMQAVPSGSYLVLWDGTATGEAMSAGNDRLARAEPFRTTRSRWRNWPSVSPGWTWWSRGCGPSAGLGSAATHRRDPMASSNGRHSGMCPSGMGRLGSGGTPAVQAADRRPARRFPPGTRVRRRGRRRSRIALASVPIDDPVLVGVSGGLAADDLDEVVERTGGPGYV
ncbi:SAM-dependent methyltransferase [Nonomuraea wenchangensis]